MTLGY